MLRNGVTKEHAGLLYADPSRLFCRTFQDLYAVLRQIVWFVATGLANFIILTSVLVSHRNNIFGEAVLRPLGPRPE